MPALFAYGTLMEGRSAHRLVAPWVRGIHLASTEGLLYLMPAGYPALVEGVGRHFEGGGVDAGPDVSVLEGPEALEELALDPETDVVVNALVGSSGLRPTMAAVRAGKRVCIANKESLVAAGELATQPIALRAQGLLGL